jgi:hypothetical protein
MSMDVESLRLSQDYNAALGVQKHLHTVKVGKPGKQTWFQAHPKPEYEFPAAVLEIKDDADRGIYMVAPAIRDELAFEVKPVLLLPYADRQSNVGIWPIALPGNDGRTSEWHSSAMRIAQEAKKGWVRMVANMTVGAYDLYTTTADLPPPKWPDKSMGELIQIAFKDRFIASMDHPIVRKLQGLS